MLIVCLLFISSLSFGVERLFYLMGTYAVIDLPTEEEVYRAYRILREVERKISSYIPDSDISRLNRNAGIKSVKVSPLTAEMLRTSIYVSERTFGFFDITIGALTINAKRKGLLSEEEARKLVSFKDLQVSGNRAFLRRKGMAVDPGGIGKGYALDVLRRNLRAKRGFVGIAGDMSLWGEKRTLAIKDPLRGGSLLQLVNRKDLCISTSGNYIKEHIEKSDRNLYQITVIHEVCALADAYATALFSMPEDMRRRFYKENPDVGALELYRDGSIYMNGAFREFFSVLLLKYEIKSQE